MPFSKCQRAGNVRLPGLVSESVLYGIKLKIIFTG